MPSKFWTDLTSADISKLGKNKVLIIPFSSVEQHGEHLPSGTDKLILDGILNTFIQNYPKFNKYLILPNISIGSASEHNSFEGTLSANSTNYIDYIIGIVDELCIRKYKKFVFLNSHGGQISHLDITAKEIKSKYKDVDIVKAHYFLFKGFEKIIPKKELLYGYHGGEFETSIMLHLHPELIKLNKIKINKLSSDFKSKKIISYEKTIKRAWNTKDLTRSGIIGNPINSTAEKGKKILNLTSRTLKKIIDEMR
tara:strand:- start:44 stop:802 length:759 start_codon:yes stop_codon:yes gene_type:complete